MSFAYLSILFLVCQDSRKTDHGGHWSIKELQQLTREDWNHSMAPGEWRDVVEKTLEGGREIRGVCGG